MVVRACGEDLDCRPVARVRESTLRFFIDKLVEDGHRAESRLSMVGTFYLAAAVLLATIYVIRQKGMDHHFDRGLSGAVKLFLVGIPLISLYIGFWGIPVYLIVGRVIASKSFNLGEVESLRRQIELGIVGVGGNKVTRRDFLRRFTDFVNRHGEVLPEGGLSPGPRLPAF